MPVTGIGGLFFRAKDPAALAAWYRDRLHIADGPYGLWQQQEGPTVFSPFPSDSDHFSADRQWMLNLRVTDLAALLEDLRGNGIDAITKPEWDSDETGRFARIHDPEGNPIELWEPPAE